MVLSMISKYFWEEAPVLFFQLRPDGTILEVNRFTSRTLEGPLKGASFASLVVDFHDRFDIQEVADDPEKDHLLNIRIQGAFPQTYYFHFFRHEEGILAFGRLDGLEIEEMRRQLLGLNQDLNNLTRELNRKNAALKRLNEQKNQFLGMAAHDLRHPVGAIRMFSEFILDEVGDDLGPEHLSFVEMIHQQSESMGRLLDDFLDVSKIEAGRLNLERVDADMVSTLVDSIRLARSGGDRKQIRVGFDPPADRLVMSFDPDRMGQVFNNLLSNAVKFSPPGSEIRVGLESLPDQVIISFQDQGPGMPSSEIKRLFRPFEQMAGGSGGRSGDKSAGLGLAICQKIVQAHGGEIQVVSREGEGACFNVCLSRV